MLVADVQPERSMRRQDAPNLRKDSNQVIHPLLGRALQSKLTLDAVYSTAASATGIARSASATAMGGR